MNARYSTAMWVVLLSERKELIPTRLQAVEEEERVLRENAKNYLRLPQARQSSWDQARAMKSQELGRKRAPQALRDLHSGNSSSCRRSYRQLDARNLSRGQEFWSGDAQEWGNDPRCSTPPRGRSRPLQRAEQIATTLRPNKTMQPGPAIALCQTYSSFIALQFIITQFGFFLTRAKFRWCATRPCSHVRLIALFSRFPPWRARRLSFFSGDYSL
jgi:hypothetical protein